MFKNSGYIYFLKKFWVNSKASGIFYLFKYIMVKII